MNDKYLLLLGILHSEDMHGYQLNQFLKHPSNAIRIGKANAYQLLAKLEEQGFVSSIEQREGNRPPRLVYSITAAGKAEMLRLVKDQLSIYQPIDSPGTIPLNFIELLTPQEALSLLRERQARLAIHCESFKDFSDEIRASHPGIDFLVRQAALEQEFLNKLVEEYQHKQKDDNDGESKQPD
ncbi:MAG: helix-turn-helix transcriptional regulator [Candidatus Marinimicrobia bacterium]|nr:helix-turn-helix transcriptional regulator [Candidatus Neomarinimicrobiota bacterium]